MVWEPCPLELCALEREHDGPCQNEDGYVLR